MSRNAAARSRTRKNYSDYLTHPEPMAPEVVTVGTAAYEATDPRRLNAFNRPHGVITCHDMIAAGIDIGVESRYETARRAGWVQVLDRYNGNIVATWTIADDEMAEQFTIDLAQHNGFYCALAPMPAALAADVAIAAGQHEWDFAAVDEAQYVPPQSLPSHMYSYK